MRSFSAPIGVTTLSWWGSLRVSITPRAGRLELCTPGRVTHAEKVAGERPDKAWPLVLQVGGWA